MDNSRINQTPKRQTAQVVYNSQVRNQGSQSRVPQRQPQIQEQFQQSQRQPQIPQQVQRQPQIPQQIQRQPQIPQQIQRQPQIPQQIQRQPQIPQNTRPDTLEPEFETVVPAKQPSSASTESSSQGYVHPEQPLSLKQRSQYLSYNETNKDVYTYTEQDTYKSEEYDYKI
jgi:hypothetical protein